MMQRVSNLITKVKNGKIMAAIPYILLKNGFDIEY